MGSAGSPPRDPSSPGKARRPAGPIHPSQRGDDRDGGTSGNAKTLWMGVRQSSRSIGAMASRSSTTHAHENAAGHRQLGETCAREAARPGSQGPTPSMGPGAAKAKPGVISEPRQDMGQGRRARRPPRCDWNGSPRRPSRIPTWRAPRSPITSMWRCWNGHVEVSTRTVPLGRTGSHGRRPRPIWKPTWWHDTKNSSTERPVRNRLFAD